MAIKNDIKIEFESSILKNEYSMNLLGFKIGDFKNRGYACFIEFRKADKTKVVFMIGPSDWQIEMIIYTNKGKFSFKDLLEIPYIRNWVIHNQYIEVGRRNLDNEVEWFINLLKISLPLVNNK